MLAGTALTIFVSYAQSADDEALCQILEKYLKGMQRQQPIEVWLERNISPGTDRSQQISKYLNTADIILLLISPDFVASDQQYKVEMQRAMERHNTQEAGVIPIILRPTDWEKTPISSLKVLPSEGNPITKWSDRDEAWLDVEKGIHNVVGELLSKKQILPPQEESIPYSQGQQRPIGSVPVPQMPSHSLFERLGLASLSTTIRVKVQSTRHRPHYRRIVATLLIAFVLLFSLVTTILHSSFCLGESCHSDPYEFQNNDLKVSFAAIQSQFYALTDKTKVQKGLMPTYNEPTSVGAVLLQDYKASQSYGIVLSVQDIYQGKYSIIINKISLVINDVPPIPRPLSVWETTERPGYNENHYRVQYNGQEKNNTIAGDNTVSPFEYVILSATEQSDYITVQIDTAIPVYLRFQIQLPYYRADVSTPMTLTLPDSPNDSFGVIFADAANWHPYKL